MECPLCKQPVTEDMFACPRDGTLLLPEEVLGLRSVSFSITGEAQTIEEIVRDAPDLPVGSRIGEYVVDEMLGEGGMGTVYAATHATQGTRAAIKVIHRALAGNTTALHRFRDEARAVSSVLHRGVVDLLDILTLPDGRPCLVMELLVGAPLSDRLREGKLEMPEKLRIAIEVCEILEAAHGQGVVHRDLKPDNLFLVHDADGSIHVKLLDFGIAKVLDENDAKPRTKTGMVVGTPAYMSPEQIRGEGADARSDIYSLGVVFYRLFCGRPPFLSRNMVDLFMHHLQRQPPPPESLHPGVPLALSPVMQQMLSKNPDNRPSLLRVRATLMAVLDPDSKIGQVMRTATGGVRAQRATAAIREQLGQPVTLRSALAVIAVALTVGGLAALFLRGREPPAEDPSPPPLNAVRLPPVVLSAPDTAPDGAGLAAVEPADASREDPPLPDPPRVAVQVTPQNVKSRVCVGDECTTAQGSCVLPAVAGKPTRVSVTAAGFYAFEATLKLAAGERHELVVSLEPLKTRRAPPRKPARR